MTDELEHLKNQLNQLLIEEIEQNMLEDKFSELFLLSKKVGCKWIVHDVQKILNEIPQQIIEIQAAKAMSVQTGDYEKAARLRDKEKAWLDDKEKIEESKKMVLKENEIHKLSFFKVTEAKEVNFYCLKENSMAIQILTCLYKVRYMWSK